MLQKRNKHPFQNMKGMKFGADSFSKGINKWKRTICYYVKIFTAIPAL